MDIEHWVYIYTKFPPFNTVSSKAGNKDALNGSFTIFLALPEYIDPDWVHPNLFSWLLHIEN